jgi:hypothetical protein
LWRYQGYANQVKEMVYLWFFFNGSSKRELICSFEAGRLPKWFKHNACKTKHRQGSDGNPPLT